MTDWTVYSNRVICSVRGGTDVATSPTLYCASLAVAVKLREIYVSCPTSVKLESLCSSLAALRDRVSSEICDLVIVNSSVRILVFPALPVLYIHIRFYQLSMEHLVGYVCLDDNICTCITLFNRCGV